MCPPAWRFGEGRHWKKQYVQKRVVPCGRPSRMPPAGASHGFDSNRRGFLRISINRRVVMRSTACSILRLHKACKLLPSRHSMIKLRYQETLRIQPVSSPHDSSCASTPTMTTFDAALCTAKAIVRRPSLCLACRLSPTPELRQAQGAVGHSRARAGLDLCDVETWRLWHGDKHTHSYAGIAARCRHDVGGVRSKQVWRHVKQCQVDCWLAYMS